MESLRETEAHNRSSPLITTSVKHNMEIACCNVASISEPGSRTRKDLYLSCE